MPDTFPPDTFTPDTFLPGDGTVAALLIPAGAPPRTIRVRPDLRAMQRLVGGYIEPVHRDGWHAYLNEEGKLAGLPPNRLATDLLFGDSGADVVAGDAVVLGDGPSAEEADVPADLVTRVTARDRDLTRAAPTELIAAVPALIGLRPADALMLITLGDGQFRGVGLASLHDLITGEDVRHIVRRTTGHNDHGTADDAAIVLVVGGEAGTGPLPHVPLVDDTRKALAAAGLAVAHAAWTPTLTAGASWLSYATGTGGALPDPGAGRVPLVRVLGGALRLPDHNYLAAVLAPHAEDALGRRKDLLDRDRPSLLVPQQGRNTRLSRRRLLTDALSAPTGNNPLDDQRVVELALALTDPLTRRVAVQLTAAAGDTRPQRLWTELTRAVPESHRAAPASLLALSAYLQGDGLLARAAHMVATAADDRHPLARLLEDAITSGYPPNDMRAAIGRAWTNGTDPLPGRSG